MLSEEEKTEIQKETGQYPYPSAACIDALKIVQHHRGWVSDESVKDIAQFLHMSNEDVESVATFYSRIYRKPVGRNVILLCDGISCMIIGYESIYEHISKKLGIGFGQNNCRQPLHATSHFLFGRLRSCAFDDDKQRSF